MAQFEVDTGQCTVYNGPLEVHSMPIGQSAQCSWVTVALEKEEVAGTSLMGPSVKGN